MKDQTLHQLQKSLEVLNAQKKLKVDFGLFKQVSNRLYLTNKEASFILSFSIRKMYDLHESKELGCFRVKGRIYHTWTQILDYVEGIGLS